jgi:hypothetical protein
MRRSLSSCSPVAMMPLAASCTPSFAQDFGITAGAQVYSGLLPYTLDGAFYNPSCIVNAPEVNLLAETSYSMTPLSCGGTYEAMDPLSGSDALYSETANGNINSIWVNKGMSYVSLSDSGGAAFPVSLIGGSATAYVSWTDTLTVTGLPAGTPVTLRITDYKFGALQLSGNTQGSDPEIIEQTILSPSIGGTPCSSAAFENFFTTSSPINSRQYFDLCTTSGATLTLSKTIQAQIAGGGSSWTTEANLNDTVYVDSLTAGVSLVTASTADYSTPGATVPTSSTSCDGTYTGTFSGDLKISSGQTCIFTGGGVTGHVTQTGGDLTLTNSTIGGNVVSHGGAFSIGPFTTIGGNLEMLNVPESTSVDEVCNTNVKGNVKLQAVGTNVQLGSSAPTCGGSAIGGNLHAQDSTGTLEIYGNNVTGNLHIQNGTSATQIYNNDVGKKLLLQGNTGSTQVFDNTVVDNLQCEGNSSISGGGNIAQKKKGQCGTF